MFYGHAFFGAATYVGGNCSTMDQAAELDVSPPPGVSLAIDASHPVYCFYADDNSAPVTDPVCPTHAVNGVYGPQLTHGNSGDAWDLPPGRTYEVQFPLVSNRELKGPAGGHCPDDLDQLTANQPHDCLITPIHIADGTDDPWMLPREEMFMAAGTTPGPNPGPNPKPGPNVRASIKAPAKLKLGALLSKGLPVVLYVPSGGSSADISLMQGHRTLAHVLRRHLKAGSMTIRLKLSKAGRARLKHASHASLRLVEKLSSPKSTLSRKVSVKR